MLQIAYWSLSPATIITVASVVVTLIVASILHERRRLTSKEGYPLPPGPPARWFWDNVMPTTNISSTFNEWAEVYGPVMTLRQGSHISVIITRVEAATEIMEKEGSALADRPPMIAVGELLSDNKRITLVGSGEHFRRLRKAIHAHFQPKALSIYGDVQFEEARKFVLDILNDQDNHQMYANRCAASIILRVTYGNSGPTSIDDPEFVHVKELIERFVETMRPGAYLVDRFPWLRYVPGYGSHLRKCYESDLKFYKSQFNRVERAMSEDIGPSFSKTLLENIHDHQLSDDEMAYLAGILFEAGSGTTTDGIVAATMAAACFPGAQLRVQEELDMVVGRERLPSWGDWNDLPQLHAFISEVLRWRPVAPLGFPHRSTRDIIWRGYYIPSGATVTGNLWSISRDPVAFPDPEKFDPQRWLDQNGQLRNDVESYPFGFGRRVCPGMHLANRSLYIALAMLLWSFRIVERPGAPIDPSQDRDNVVAHLPYFVADFVPRMEEARLREKMVM